MVLYGVVVSTATNEKTQRGFSAVLTTTTIMNTYIVLNVENQMIIKYEFKLYPNIVCDDKKQLWQLEHFRNKRTYPTKKLTITKIEKHLE